MDLTSLCFIAIAIGLIVMMVAQGLSRRVELLSMRNLYLGGFIVFQLFSPARVIWAQTGGMFQLRNINNSATTMLLYAAVFLPVFLLSYHYTVLWKWLAGKLRPAAAVSSDSVLISLALALVGIGVVFRIAPRLPVVSSVLYHASIGFAAVACGMVGWVWAKRRANLAVIGLGCLVFLVSAGLALQNAYGRRPLLAIGFGLAWGAYYSLGHRLKPAKLILWSSPIFVLAIVVVSAFTAIRGTTRSENLSVTQVMKSMLSAKVKSGAADVMGGQTCGAAAMWCIENYPRPHRTRHLFSLRQMGNQFIPRFLWKDKPKPLANDLARMAQIPGISLRITLPPGVLGYAAAEGGAYAVVVYAIFFGGFVRFFDEIVRLNRDDPLIVTVCGCSTGHFLGLARGDLANFTLNIVVTFFATLFCIWLIRRFVARPTPNQQVYWPAAPMQQRR